MPDLVTRDKNAIEDITMHLLHAMYDFSVQVADADKCAVLGALWREHKKNLGNIFSQWNDNP